MLNPPHHLDLAVTTLTTSPCVSHVHKPYLSSAISHIFHHIAGHKPPPSNISLLLIEAGFTANIHTFVILVRWMRSRGSKKYRRKQEFLSASHTGRSPGTHDRHWHCAGVCKAHARLMSNVLKCFMPRKHPGSASSIERSLKVSSTRH